jgi:hypothetical protein
MLGQHEFEDRPFGFSGGELVEPTRDPAPPWPEPFTVPQWSEEERRREQEVAAEERQAPAMTAVEQMMSNAAALGELDDDRPAPGPPADVGPLQPFQPPEWSEEQRREEQAARDREEAARRARLERAVAEALPAAHPPPQRDAA